MAFASAAKALLSPPRARVLLVGSGRMGHVRAQALYANPRFDLRGVVDRDVARAAELGDAFRTPHYPSLSEAIRHSGQSTDSSTKMSASSGRPPLDGIIISTPTPTHEPLIAEAAYHGISIFTEKPVDETASKIRHLFRTARRHNVLLCCGFQRRFDPSYLALYRQVNAADSGIGTPLTASVFFGDHPAPPRAFLLQGGGNIIADCAAHDVDYVRWALGRDAVASVYATGTSSDEELKMHGVVDNATVVLKFVRGTVVTLTLSRGSNYGYDQRCEIFGSRGLASVKNQPSHSSELADAAGVHRPKWQHSFPQRFEAAFAHELDAFADTLLSGTPWTVTEEDCVSVQRICDAALESCESGEVVHLVHEEEEGDEEDHRALL